MNADLTSPQQTTSPTPTNAYDEVPYDSHPFVQTHPDRLCTVATLFGMRPTPVTKCRVLELGCASGGNLIPMADELRDSEFIGLDLSKRQIDEGQQTISSLGLNNIDLRHASITDVDESYGKFDYIICHGVFSWVPNEVQDKILAIFRDNMNPHGVAYISYNTYPGWHMRGMIRDMMRYHSAHFNTPKMKTRQARALLDFLSQSVNQPNSAYAMMLKQEVETLRHQADHYLFHEHLEEVNDPLYFHQFAERALAHGLGYLAEARVGTMVLSNFGKDIEKTLRVLATDQIQVEQYMDFLRNRMFRETLLCSSKIQPNWSIQPEILRRFQVCSSAFPVYPSPDGKAPATPRQDEINLSDGENVSYQSMSRMQMATNQPLLKAAMKILRTQWPKPMAFDTLRDQARELLGGGASSETVNQDTQMLALGILNCYMGSDLVELHSYEPSFTREPSEKPVANPIARLQAPNAPMVTNRRHEVVKLNDLDRQLVPLLDGTRGKEELIEKLTEVTKAGHLTVQKDNQTITDENQITTALREVIEPSLRGLAMHALIIE